MSAPSTIIVACRNDVMSDVYCLAFEGMFGSTAIVCADVASASRALKLNPTACVLIENSLPGGPLNSFFQCQASLAKRASVFVLGGDATTVPADMENIRVELLAENPPMALIVERVGEALKLAERPAEFCRITLKSLLMRGDRLRCDVYVKLGDGKFVKVLHANDAFDEAEYERFRAKGVDHLFLPRSDFLGVMDDLLSRAAELNRAPAKLTVDGSVKANLAIFQIVHAAFETDGFTPQLQKLTVASVELAINTIKRNPRVGELLERLDKNRDGYLAWHSTALSFLSCKLATLLEWHSEPTFYKLSLAAMLHDIVLPTDDLARVQTLADMKRANLSDKQRASVLRHPIEAAQLVNSLDNVPGEVAFIVEQHHERQDGTGFPRGIDHKDISSISALFIIAHDIVHTMFEAPPEKFKMTDFLRMRESEKAYTKGAFGQVFRALLAKASEF